MGTYACLHFYSKFDLIISRIPFSVWLHVSISHKTYSALDFNGQVHVHFYGDRQQFVLPATHSTKVGSDGKQFQYVLACSSCRSWFQLTFVILHIHCSLPTAKTADLKGLQAQNQMQKHPLADGAPLFPTVVEVLTPIKNLYVKNQQQCVFSKESLNDSPAILPFSGSYPKICPARMGGRNPSKKDAMIRKSIMRIRRNPRIALQKIQIANSTD